MTATFDVSSGITTGKKPWGGPGAISSATTSGATVRENGSARGSQPVLLIDMLTGKTIVETVSAADGSWSFQDINTTRFYTVRVIDSTGQLNGAVLDWAQAQAP